MNASTASNPPTSRIPEDVDFMSTEEMGEYAKLRILYLLYLHNIILFTHIAKPTSTNLTVIRWRNERGDVKKFWLKQSIIHRWRKIGNLVVPRQQLEVWAKRLDDEECCEAVLSHWLDHPPRHYPATWGGLYELLDDSQLGQVATELKQAVDNAI